MSAEGLDEMSVGWFVEAFWWTHDHSSISSIVIGDAAGDPDIESG